MKCLLIGDKDRIFNKTNTEVLFEISEPIDITLTAGAESNTITVDDNGNDLTKDAYIIRNTNNANIALLLSESEKMFSEWSEMYIPKGEVCSFIINPTSSRFLADFYDDMKFAFSNFIFRVKINGAIATSEDYSIVDGKVTINKESKKLRMANNVIEVITNPKQDGLTAVLSYDGYNGNSFIEGMYSSLSDAPTRNEIQLSNKKRRGLTNETMTIDGGGVLSLQVYSLDGMNDYSILEKTRFRVTIKNDSHSTTYHNCTIKHGASSIEDEVNTSSYDIEYGYKDKGGNQ